MPTGLPLLSKLVVPLAALVLLAGGCAKIITHSYNQDRFLRLELKDSPPRGEAQLSTRWRFDGDELVVDVDRWHTCLREGEKVYHRTRTTERHIDDKSLHTSILILGAGATPLGALYAATPGTFVSEDSEDPDGDKQKNQYFGMAAAAVGTGLLVTWLVDTIRARDSKQDLGELRFSAGPGHPYGCQEDQGEGLSATLSVPGLAEPMTALVDDTGVVRFDLGGLGQLSASKTATAHLRIGNREELIPLLMSPHYRKLYKAQAGGAR
jgi:hypothetical protein